MIKKLAFLLVFVITTDFSFSQSKISTSNAGTDYYSNSSQNNSLNYNSKLFQHQQMQNIAKNAQETYYHNQKILTELKFIIESNLEKLTIEELNKTFRKNLNNNLIEVNNLIKKGAYEQYTPQIQNIINKIELTFKYYYEDEDTYLNKISNQK